MRHDDFWFFSRSHKFYIQVIAIKCLIRGCLSATTICHILSPYRNIYHNITQSLAVTREPPVISQYKFWRVSSRLFRGFFLIISAFSVGFYTCHIYNDHSLFMARHTSFRLQRLFDFYAFARPQQNSHARRLAAISFDKQFDV